MGLTVVRAAFLDGDIRIHPVVAGEVLLGGVAPWDAFDGLEWIDTDPVSDRDLLDWLASWPRGTIRSVGWADCAIVHGAAQLVFYQLALGRLRR